MNPDDNISDDVPAPISAPADDSITDEYMNKFELLEAQIQKGRLMIDTLPTQPNQDYRLFTVMRWAEQQQKMSEDMYALMVEMNNFFAPK